MKDYLRTELKEDSAASSAEKSRTYIEFRRFGKAVVVAAITITLLFSTAMVANAQFREKVIAWVVETFEKYSIFELHVRPTFDFQQELLWNGEDLEVLEPLWLRREIAEKVKRMWNKYKDGE